MARKRTPDELPDPKQSMWYFIGRQLRFQREQRGLSGEALGRILKASKATVSRIETGQDRLDGTQAELIDKAWNTGGLFGLLVWYASIGHDPAWFAQYVELEQRSAMLRIFEALVVPGLLQTPEYAQALLSVGSVADPDKVLRDRLNRQRLLDADRPPFFEILLSQTAVEWPIGSPEIMRDQLTRLLEISEMSHVVLRVVPRSWATAAYPGCDGSFFLLSGDDFGEVAYSESAEAGRLVSTPTDVRSYAVRFGRIGAKALAEGPSRDLVRQFLEEYESGSLA